MKIAVVYDSSTGTTAKAAEAMGRMFREQGHECRVQSVREAAPEEVARADLICVGSWVKGMFVIRQHPTARSLDFIQQLGDLGGTQAVVFCTYKLAVGSTLRQMASALERQGGSVVGQFKFRGPEPDRKFAAFVRQQVAPQQRE